MTDKERLKLLLDIPAGDTSEDSRLELLLEAAEAYLRSFCRVDLIDENMRPTVLSMAAEDFGRMGGEGVSFRSVSGASETYRGSYSDGIMASLKRFRRAGVVG